MENALKVLFVTQSLGKGGAERLVLDISNAFKKAYPNVIIKIAALGPANDYKEISEGLDITYCNSKVELSLTGKSKINIAEYEKLVDEFKPDIIHSHTYITELVSREKPRQNVKYFTHAHADFKEFEPLRLGTFFSKNTITNYFERLRMFKRYKKVKNEFITISKNIDANLRKQLPSNWHKRVHLLPNAIDFSKFKADVKKIEGKTIKLITIGRLYPVKNQQFLIEVMDQLVQNFSQFDWHLTIIGEGPERKNLEKQIASKNLADKVHLTGLVADVERKLDESHIYIHGAADEPFGLVMIEAMASSLPVVSIDGGGNRDFMENGVNGFIQKELDAKRFAGRIVQLLEEEGLYEKIGQNARKTAQNYDIRPYIDKLFELYTAKSDK